MAIIIFLNWWYKEGWANSFRLIGGRANNVLNEFSVPILLRTLFEPWKQIKLYTGQNASIDLKLHVLADNVFSRIFGFVIRSFVMVIGFAFSATVLILGAILALVWPILPITPVIFTIMAVLST